MEIENAKNINLFCSQSRPASNQKICQGCKKELPLDKFEFLKNKQKYNSWCRICAAKAKPVKEAPKEEPKTDSRLMYVLQRIDELAAAIKELQVDIEVLKARSVPTPDSPQAYVVPTDLEDLPARLEAFTAKLASLDGRVHVLEGYKEATKAGPILQQRQALMITILEQSPNQELGRKAIMNKLGLNRRQMYDLYMTLKDRLEIIDNPLDRRFKKYRLIK